MEISETKIRKRKDTNTYYFDVTINGKRFRRSGFKTKKEALASSIELIDNETKKTPTTNAKVFFKDYYMDWVKAYNKLDLSVGQRNWYKRSYKIFLDYFGEHIKMSDVSRKEYQKFLNDYGVGRNSETIRKVNNCISPVFNEAKYEGLIERDPTYRVEYNGTVSDKKASDKYLNIDDYLKLIELFRERESASYTTLLIMSLTGARNKEVLNLTLEDIDLENNENLHNPVERLTKIMEDGYEKDLDKFSQLLDWYFLESIKDLKDVSKSSESYDTDYVMIKIMDKIRSDYLHNIKMITSLYDEFRKNYKDEI